MKPHEPKTAAVNPERVEHRDIVSRSLVNSIIEALGFDPADIVAVWIDRHEVTVVRKQTHRQERRYINNQE